MQVITLKNKQTEKKRNCPKENTTTVKRQIIIKKRTENHKGWKVVGKTKTLESSD